MYRFRRGHGFDPSQPQFLWEPFLQAPSCFLADVIHQLDGPARTRRTTVESLALAVLRIMARDRLVDAVLDDRGADEH